MISESLKRFFEAGAVALEASSNHQIRLDEAGSVFLVETGFLNVFAYRTKGGEQLGPRLHLCRAEPGDILPGVRDASGQIQLVAAGVPGTTVVKFPASRLEEAERQPERRDDLAVVIERWVLHQSESAALQPPPRRFQEPLRGKELSAEAGTVLRTQAVLWIEPSEGELLFLGEAPFASGAGRALPLTAATWATASRRLTGTVHDTRERIEAGGIHRHLEAFERIFLDVVSRNVASVEERRGKRFEARKRRDNLARDQAFSILASLLAEPAAAKALPVTASEDELLRACEIVGKAQGIPMAAPREESAAVLSSNPLRRITKASRVRWRQVALRGEWWREDNGPLLGYRFLDEGKQQKRAVALLPVTATSYEMVDPVEKSRVAVTPEVAAQLDFFAFMFFRPLPASGVTGKTLWRLGLSSSRRDLWALVLMGTAGGLLSLLVPIVTGYFFGTVIPGAEYGPLAQVTAGLLVAALSAGVFEITRSIATLRIEGKLDNILQAAVWDRLLSLPVSFFRDYTVGDLAMRAMTINMIRQTLTGNTVTMVLASVFSLFNLLLLYYYSWKLALWATGLVLVLLGVIYVLTQRQLRHQREIQKIQGGIAGLVFQLLSAIAKLRVSGAERRAFLVWSTRFRQQRALSMDARKTGNHLTAFTSTAPVLVSMVIFACVQWSLRKDGSFETGDFLAFNSALGQFLAAALSMVGVFSSALAVVPLYERMKPILETSPEVDETKADPGELSGSLEVCHVSFRYRPDGPLVLKDVSFRVQPGEFVALVGPSGSGKSTLLRLILGFDNPEEGGVLFDGQSLSGLDVQSVRSQIGVVLQGGKLMAGDIFSNIVGASTHLTLEDAREAARMSGLEEDINGMPMGMQTVISEGAGTFSGGQKQRLMVARAIVKKPRILLFDEATSALDNRTQQIVSRSLESLAATRVVIAHRLSTIMNADRIYVLQAGQVVEAGTYAELMQQEGAFFALARRQIS